MKELGRVHCGNGVFIIDEGAMYGDVVSAGFFFFLDRF